MTDLRAAIKSACPDLRSGRIQTIPLHHANLAELERGVVFVYASWSGQAIASLRFLCKALAEVPESSFSVIVIDTDGYDGDTFIKLFGELPQGNGEAYWICDGTIVHRDRGYTESLQGLRQGLCNSDLVRERILEFMG